MASARLTPVGRALLPSQPCGSSDIGAAIIYVLVFVGLILSQSGLYLGLDRRLTPKLGRLGFLASGPLPG